LGRVPLVRLRAPVELFLEAVSCLSFGLLPLSVASLEADELNSFD
jgi:hypothetical protein